eukprot:CAMPEP_0117425688 /NCGR_PEP_ID=MMETSP0758-20121206/5937_1 /TAXON_ID=63605 /ORGANISM="Percolomonas cosmopolitus, Strain AE-1 (ATCC 50343)" /LENGTH=211 /DNA_ID=CAMNT_0005210377 /DNA_START=156 /DNA_END=791 /DNA_ORIENTATION=+
MTIGSKNVGKTCLVRRLVEGTYSSKSSATIGYDFSNHRVTFFGTPFQMHYWDTAGDEKFTIVFQKTAFTRANLILLCFDLSSDESIEDQCGIWVKTIEENCSEKFSLLLVGCKSDIKIYSTVFEAEIQDYLLHLRKIFRRVEYWEVSSQDNHYIRELKRRIAYVSIKEKLFPQVSYVNDNSDDESDENDQEIIQLHLKRNGSSSSKSSSCC